MAAIPGWRRCCSSQAPEHPRSLDPPPLQATRGYLSGIIDLLPTCESERAFSLVTARLSTPWPVREPGVPPLVPATFGIDTIPSRVLVYRCEYGMLYEMSTHLLRKATLHDIDWQRNCKQSCKRLNNDRAVQLFTYQPEQLQLSHKRYITSHRIPFP